MKKITLAVVLTLAGLNNSLMAEEKLNSTEGAADKQQHYAEMAARLVMRGESQKSPLMLLAAADLLDAAKESERDIAEVASEADGSGEPTKGKSAPAFSRMDLEARALELASTDKEKELVQQWITRPRPRGLILEQGRNLESMKLKGITHKIIFRGVVDNGYNRSFTNVKFEGKKKARVVVIGDGDGDLDLWVYDGNTGGLIGSDTDEQSVCVVEWTPRYMGPFKIKVANVGAISERCIILVNW